MTNFVLNSSELREIDFYVSHFQSQRHLFEGFAKALVINLGESPKLAPFIHFIKYRVKDQLHLKDKLNRKAIYAKNTGRMNKKTIKNLYNKITDLAGVRILHLHTDQILQMNEIILEILDEHQYRLIEGPKAICWDNEYAKLFSDLGIKTESRDSMYTSVHFIIEANQKTKIRAELQVRTLMEEVWGEVSHRIN
ncbi:MAG: RelA/SpoT domain-containing protein [Chitinispirillaceae bacterium]|jgi:ppGpp synthetase/RelA/SpoT-type nucleotidyltranferase